METQWVTWALQALIIAVLYWFKQQLDRNTKTVTELSVELPSNYMPRKESEDSRRELRESIHSLRGEVGVISNRVSVIEGARK